MQHRQQPSVKLVGTVTEVLPLLGLANVAIDDHRSWAVTRSTQGDGMEALAPGVRVELTVTQHPGFSVVSAYATLD
jgi:hypothetical protein